MNSSSTGNTTGRPQGRHHNDFDNALKALQDDQPFTGRDGILIPADEGALAAELDSHLAQDAQANRKQGDIYNPVRQM